MRPLAKYLTAALFVVSSSCSTTNAPAPQPLEPGTILVPGERAWISTGISLDRGKKLLIEEVPGRHQVFVKGKKKQTVAARGTYLFDVEEEAYPLEPDRLHDDRRYPAYCLIARMGEAGTPFYVGSRFQGLAPAAGTLWLGINDPHPKRNTGAFACRVSLDYPDPPEPMPTRSEGEKRKADEKNPEAPAPEATQPTPRPHAVADANVVILYIDGLRPDVVTEMAEWGHMPNFREVFIDNGTWIRNSFTVQPSLTHTSFASMITGCYSNRHGVKMQTYYDRESDTYINGLSERHFSRFAAEVKARGVKAIYDYFPDSFAAGAMPFGPFKPGVLQLNLIEWVHRAVNRASTASQIKWDMDEVQTRFALDLASSPKAKVMLVWLPNNDVVSEHTPHGQFGGARQVLARVDARLGEIFARLKNRDRFDQTYFILTSDHGHVGGHEIVNRRYDVKREVFHAYLQMNVMSLWQRFDYPGAPEGRLGAVSDCDGAVGIFLPSGNVDSQEFSKPNTYASLSHYGLADGRQVNAVELFAEFSSAGRWSDPDLTRRPVDFAVVKVDDDAVLLYKTMERQALIHTRRNARGELEFRYEPVRRFVPGQPPEPILQGDPLGYLGNEKLENEVGDIGEWLADYHTGPEWLQAAYRTDYAACVDTLALYFRWDGPKTKDSPVPSQPEILLFSNMGWVFEPRDNLASRIELSIGSRHGMAFRTTTNNCFFVSGPGIKKGTIEETPHRIVDILPTVLEMMGRDAASEGMDGSPAREIWVENP